VVQIHSPRPASTRRKSLESQGLRRFPFREFGGRSPRVCQTENSRRRPPRSSRSRGAGESGHGRCLPAATMAAQAGSRPCPRPREGVVTGLQTSSRRRLAPFDRGSAVLAFAAIVCKADAASRSRCPRIVLNSLPATVRSTSCTTATGTTVRDARTSSASGLGPRTGTRRSAGPPSGPGRRRTSARPARPPRA
jgi:hypothetical protein